MLEQTKGIVASALAVMMIMTSLPAFARDTALEPTFLEIEAAMRDTGAANLPKAIEARKSSVSGTAITSLAALVFLATTAQIYKENYFRAKRRGESTALGNVISKDMLVDAAQKVATSEEFWMGVFGAHATGTLVHLREDAIRSLFAEAMRGTLQTFLISGVSSVITFAGWEAFSQLWREGVMRLADKNQADWIAKSHGVTFRVFSHLNDPRYRESEDFQIFQNIVMNIADVLGDPILRDRWEYNVFRLHWMTGDFWTLSSVMAVFPTAGALAGAQVGGAAGAAIGGFVGGVAGVGVLTVVPQDWNDRATEIAQMSRQWVNSRQLETNEIQIRQSLMQFQQKRRLQAALRDGGIRPSSSEDEVANHLLSSQLRQRSSIRQHLLTALFETYFKTAMAIQNNQDAIEDAAHLLEHKDHWKELSFEYQNQSITYDQLRERLCSSASSCDVDYQLKTLKSAKATIDQAAKNLRPLALQAMTVYAHEVQLMDRYLHDSRQPLTAAMSTAMQDELVWACDVSMKLRNFLAAKSPEMIASLRLDDSILEAIRNSELPKIADFQIADFYLNTFDEARFLKQFKDDRESLRKLSPNDVEYCVRDAKALAPQEPFW